MNVIGTYTLSNGVKIPKIGFGTWQMQNGETTFNAVKTALEIGYRHIDTAAAYGNESSVGQAVRDSELARHEIFVTTKLGSKTLDFVSAKTGIENSLKNLGLDYIDLLLIHWPNPIATRPNYAERNAAVWRAMEEAVQAGKVRALGLANFQQHHMNELFKIAKIKPVVNQIYCNPSDQQEDIIVYNRAHDLLTEAYSPLGTGEIFKIRALENIAEKYGKTVAQIVLRWHLQKGYLPLPKSVTPERIAENVQLFDFELADSDMAFIDSLHGALQPHKHPDSAPF